MRSEIGHPPLKFTIHISHFIKAIDGGLYLHCKSILLQYNDHYSITMSGNKEQYNANSHLIATLLPSMTIGRRLSLATEPSSDSLVSSSTVDGPLDNSSMFETPRPMNSPGFPSLKA